MKKYNWKKDPVIAAYLNKRKNLSLFGMITLGIIIVLALMTFTSWIFMLLWNWLMPIIFSLPTITITQSLGLILIINVLFGISKSNNKKEK